MDIIPGTPKIVAIDRLKTFIGIKIFALLIIKFSPYKKPKANTTFLINFINAFIVSLNKISMIIINFYSDIFLRSSNALSNVNISK